MIYVQRNENGEIVGVYSVEQKGFAEEAVEPDSEEVAEFYKTIEG